MDILVIILLSTEVTNKLSYVGTFFWLLSIYELFYLESFLWASVTKLNYLLFEA